MLNSRRGGHLLARDKKKAVVSQLKALERDLNDAAKDKGLH